MKIEKFKELEKKINGQNFNQSYKTINIVLMILSYFGHIASIFPNMSNLSDALYDKSSLINLNDGYPDVSRLTMTLNEINKSKQIILLIKGEKKFNLLMDKRSDSELLPVDHLFIQMIDKIKIFKVL